jgi:hypothetical protein
MDELGNLLSGEELVFCKEVEQQDLLAIEDNSRPSDPYNGSC